MKSDRAFPIQCVAFGENPDENCACFSPAARQPLSPCTLCYSVVVRKHLSSTMCPTDKRSLCSTARAFKSINYDRFCLPAKGTLWTSFWYVTFDFTSVLSCLNRADKRQAYAHTERYRPRLHPPINGSKNIRVLYFLSRAILCTNHFKVFVKRVETCTGRLQRARKSMWMSCNRLLYPLYRLFQRDMRPFQMIIWYFWSRMKPMNGMCVIFYLYLILLVILWLHF